MDISRLRVGKDVELSISDNVDHDAASPRDRAFAAGAAVATVLGAAAAAIWPLYRNSLLLVVLGSIVAAGIALVAPICNRNSRLKARGAQVQSFITLQDDLSAALPSRDAVVEVILRFAQLQTGASAVVLEIPDGDELVYEAAGGSLRPYVGTRVKRTGSLSGLCLDRGEVLSAANTRTDPRVDTETCRRIGIGSMIVVPFADGSAGYGVLTVCSPRPYAFTPADVQTLQLAAKNLTSGLRAAHQFASLQNSERRSRALTDAMPQLVGIVDGSLQFVYVNERCRVFTGKAIEALNAGSASDLVHPDDRHFAASARVAIDANTEFECELRVRRADGVYRWYSVRAVPLTVSGQLPHWLCAATDIEERKIAEVFIAESAARLARAAQSDRAVASGLREANRLLVMAEEMAHVGHYRLDLITDDVFWSDEVYRTYGVPMTFTPNLEWVLSAYHPDDRDDIMRTVRQTLEDGRPFTFTARIVRPDGTIRTVAAGGQTERAPDGSLRGLFGVFQDITSIKDIERQRERLDERVVLATKGGKIGIWEWDIAADRLEWDSAMYALYGIREQSVEPTYDGWLATLHPEDRAGVVTKVKAALAGGPALDTEFRVIWPTGDIRYLHTIGTLLDDPADDGMRMVGANWDITETRTLAEDLRAEKERAEQASRSKTEFLARMSHEIRTPMNGIIGFTTLVLDGELSAEQRRYVALLRDAGRSLLAIINDILDFSKLEAGRIELEHIPVNLGSLIDGALSIVRGEARPKAIALHVDVHADIPTWVSGDPTRLRQTVLNLLTNALKFTDRGSVSVRVGRDLATSADHVRFEVSDTGIGIAPEQRHLLFDDFSQLEKSTARRYGGTGLGLAICKRLVEAMDGTIGVESTAGAGSTFWFTARLPEVGAPVQGDDGDSVEHIAPRRILVADDNGVNQIVVGGLLTHDGHAVVFVENGAEAIEAVRTGDFDIVLMDMQMPVMDGIEATVAIRQLPGPRGQIAIVAVTANAMAEEVSRCHAAGMNGHLAKPIDRELLRRAIERWTPARARPVLALEPAADVEAAPSPYADSPIIGVATLLDIFDGDTASVSDILAAAIASIDVDLARIAESAALPDMTVVYEAAHRMKGTSGSIRSQRIMQISAKIQTAAKSNPPTIDADLIASLQAAVAELGRAADVSRRQLESDEGLTPPNAPLPA